jgi:hypothetical protein
MNIEDLKAQHGGHWGTHPDHKPADWVSEVHQGNTRLGYWEWLSAMLED